MICEKLVSDMKNIESKEMATNIQAPKQGWVKIQDNTVKLQ